MTNSEQKSSIQDAKVRDRKPKPTVIPKQHSFVQLTDHAPLLVPTLFFFVVVIIVMVDTTKLENTFSTLN